MKHGPDSDSMRGGLIDVMPFHCANGCIQTWREGPYKYVVIMCS